MLTVCTILFAISGVVLIFCVDKFTNIQRKGGDTKNINSIIKTVAVFEAFLFFVVLILNFME